MKRALHKGKTYNRLTVVEDTFPKLRCLCFCGKEHYVLAGNLVSGNVKSCGCRRTESRLSKDNKYKTHGLAGTLEYTMWTRSKRRAKEADISFTLEPTDIHIPEICPVLGMTLRRTHAGRIEDDSPSLDRIDNNDGYHKYNVRVISNKANRMKHTFSLKDLERFMAYIKGEV